MSINRQRKSNSVLKRICRKALLAIIFIGIPITVFLFTFSVKKVEVVGEGRYTEKQIREMLLQSRLDYNSVFLYVKHRYFVDPQIPFVEKLDVEISSNHEITVYVYEKIIIGCVYVMGEYLYFDKDGIVVETSSDRVENIPIIEGLQFDQIVLHEKLNVQNDKLFDVILNITKLIDKNKLRVEKVRFDENENVTLTCNDVKVLLGKKTNYDDAISDLKNILMKAEGTGLIELDMRNYVKGSGYVIGKSNNSTE